jgi:hypothetical protein
MGHINGKIGTQPKKLFREVQMGHINGKIGTQPKNCLGR